MVALTGAQEVFATLAATLAAAQRVAFGERGLAGELEPWVADLELGPDSHNGEPSSFKLTLISKARSSFSVLQQEQCFPKASERVQQRAVASCSTLVLGPAILAWRLGHTELQRGFERALPPSSNRSTFHAGSMLWHNSSSQANMFSFSPLPGITVLNW